jgi:trans-aconitate methyltransferase
MSDPKHTNPNPGTEAFFERMYRQDPDPWNFALSEYEQARYNATMAALGNRRYDRAFEPGCSIGVLTQRLATICAAIEAIDISTTAVEKGKERCREYPHVRISAAALGDYVPEPELDLIVLSEIGYYFLPYNLRVLATRLIGGLQRNGTLLAVHWLGQSPDHTLSGDEVHEILLALPGLTHELSERHRGFRLDRWRRA